MCFGLDCEQALGLTQHHSQSERQQTFIQDLQVR